VDSTWVCADSGHFFVSAGGVDVIERQGDFDEFFRQFDGLGHGGSWLWGMRVVYIQGSDYGVCK
jgi:hypothetical protein